MKYFTSIENVEWTRYWMVLGMVLIIWVGLAEIIPTNIYKPVSVVMQAIQAGILFAARASKFVEGHLAPPQDGKP